MILPDYHFILSRLSFAILSHSRLRQKKNDDKNTTRTNKRMKTSVYLLNRVTVCLICDKHLIIQYKTVCCLPWKR